MTMMFRNLTLAASLAAMLSCTTAPSRQQARAFATPEEAVKALTDAVKAKRPEALTAVFGSEAQDLIDAGDPGAGQRARTVFKVAVAERWHLEDRGADKVLVIGNEDWPFPIPLVKSADGWRFDIAKGREEVLNRQVGRNELGAIKVARTYVFAQRLYAKSGHDGKPAGLFARTFRSEPGKQNGLYWVAARGQRPSPLGDLVAEAAAEGRTVDKSRASQPFHGYYFRILTAQSAAAPDGAKNYLQNGDLAGGFALVAWPAQYDVTGVMTFVINQDGRLFQKDLGPATDKTVPAITTYDPDSTWTPVQ
jgi:hypothetical protein